MTTPAAPVVRCASHIPASQITRRLALIPRTDTSHFTTSHLAPLTLPPPDILSSDIPAQVVATTD